MYCGPVVTGEIKQILLPACFAVALRIPVQLCRPFIWVPLKEQRPSKHEKQ